METFEIHKNATVSLTFDVNISIKILTILINLNAGVTFYNTYTFYNSIVYSITVIREVCRKYMDHYKIKAITGIT